MVRVNMYLILLLLASIMLVIMSAWSLNTFMRLKKAKSTYPSGDAFEDACHVSPIYTNGGEVVAAGMLAVSLLLLVVSAIVIHRNYK